MSRTRNRQKKKRRIGFYITAFCTIITAIAFFALVSDVIAKNSAMKPDELLGLYVNCINEGRYKDMYALLAEQSKTSISEEEFVTRNKNIYEGIGAKNIAVRVTEISDNGEQTIISYDSQMDTLAGDISFSNSACFTTTADNEYRLIWSDRLIFPDLDSDDKVKMNTLKSERGNIMDRNGEMLAGKGVASSVGFVPGKMGEDKEADIEKAAELLGVSAESIHKKLRASYVKDDMFIPIRTIPKGYDEFEGRLLTIKGIKIIDTQARYYPLGEKASHLTGYIQNVTAEDLELLEGQGYNAGSVIGRAGLERTFEERLRGIDGYEIVIQDKEGKVKQILAKKGPKNGETISMTIDAKLQGDLYDKFRDDKSVSVAMNPKTGEILALVSTPTYDANDFVLGMTQAKWDELNKDENKPLYNRFKAALCPGSGFKPIIGAIGLTSGKLSPDDDYGRSGRSWQKDASWGGYKITTLKEYDKAVLQNALIYSDNIYFAKAALNIGKDILATKLLNIGFDEAIPFEIGLYWSSFSNNNEFSSEIQLADSGYGQGQVLVNPIHMACMYSAFVNDGNMIKPYLLRDGNTSPEYWKEQAFTKEAARVIREDLKQVVRQGAGGLAKIDGVTLAGKTGTAEIKMSKDDKNGTELGWFNAFTADENDENPLLIIAMVEDVKDRGGSGYVVPKVTKVFEGR